MCCIHTLHIVPLKWYKCVDHITLARCASVEEPFSILSCLGQKFIPSNHIRFIHRLFLCLMCTYSWRSASTRAILMAQHYSGTTDPPNTLPGSLLQVVTIFLQYYSTLFIAFKFIYTVLFSLSRDKLLWRGCFLLNTFCII